MYMYWAVIEGRARVSPTLTRQHCRCVWYIVLLYLRPYTTNFKWGNLFLIFHNDRYRGWRATRCQSAASMIHCRDNWSYLCMTTSGLCLQWIINGRLLTGNTNLIWTVMMSKSLQVRAIHIKTELINARTSAHDFIVKLRPCMCSPGWRNGCNLLACFRAYLLDT